MHIPPERTGYSLRERWQAASRRVVERARSAHLGQRRLSQVSVASSTPSVVSVAQPNPATMPEDDWQPILSRDLTRSPMAMAFIAEQQQKQDQEYFPESALRAQLMLEASHNRPSPRLLQTLRDYVTMTFPHLQGLNLEPMVLLATRTNFDHQKATPEEHFANVLSLLEALQIALSYTKNRELCTRAPEVALLKLWNDMEPSPDRDRCQSAMFSVIQGRMQLEADSVYECPFSRSKPTVSLDQLFKRANFILQNSSTFKLWKEELEQLPCPGHLKPDGHSRCRTGLYRHLEEFFQKQFIEMYNPLVSVAYAMKELRRPLFTPPLCNVVVNSSESLLAPKERMKLQRCLQRSPWAHATQKSWQAFQFFTDNLISDMYLSSGKLMPRETSPSEEKALWLIMATCDLNLTDIAQFERQLNSYTEPNQLMAVFYRLIHEVKTDHREQLMAIWVKQFETAIDSFLRKTLKEELENTFRDKFLARLFTLPDDCIEAINNQQIKMDAKQHSPLVHHELKAFQQRWQALDEKKGKELQESGLSNEEKARQLTKAREQHKQEFLDHYLKINYNHAGHPVCVWLSHKENELWREVREDYCRKLGNTLPWSVMVRLLGSLNPVYKMLEPGRPLEEWVHNRLPKDRQQLAASLEESGRPEIKPGTGLYMPPAVQSSQGKQVATGN